MVGIASYSCGAPCCNQHRAHTHYHHTNVALTVSKYQNYPEVVQVHTSYKGAIALACLQMRKNWRKRSRMMFHLNYLHLQLVITHSDTCQIETCHNTESLYPPLINFPLLRFVECKDCGRKMHQICVLHYDVIWSSG